MFGNLVNNVSKTRQTARKSGIEIPQTVEFVRALKAHNLRISYAALADAAEALGEHTATNMSAGQRGSRLLGGIPGDLQPHVCNASGGYSKGIEWADAPNADPKVLRKLGYVRPEGLAPFITAFQKAQEQAEASAEPTEEVTTEES